METKDERIEIRISARDKKMFQEAQKLSGDKSFSSFIARIVKEQAEKIVARNNRILASQKDRDVFFDAVFGESQPNASLVEAARRYQSQNDAG